MSEVKKKATLIGEATQVTAEKVAEALKKVENTSNETVSDQKETVLIYCGPSSNFLARYTSFKNGYPIHVKEYLEKYPSLKSLFVEPEKFSDFENNVLQKGTVENILFEKAREYFSKAVK